MRALFRIGASKKLKNKRSFTLVELIFEILVLSLVVIPTAILLVQLTLDIVQTETNATATALAVQVAETMMWNYTFSNVSGGSGTFASPYQKYSYAVTAACVEGANLDLPVGCPGTDSYKRVKISVSNAALPNPVDIYVLFSNI